MTREEILVKLKEAHQYFNYAVEEEHIDNAIELINKYEKMLSKC